MTIVLASGSAVRQRLLAAAGVTFTVRPAHLDERILEQPLLKQRASPANVAKALAAAKAIHVSDLDCGALVIGADQTLDLAGQRFSKPKDLADAQRQILKLAGKTHTLYSALACAQGGQIVWNYVDHAELTMRPLEVGDVARYIRGARADVLQSVGAYQVEGYGIQLFERIDGDYFTVLGLPLLPLLAFLRRNGELQ